MTSLLARIGKILSTLLFLVVLTEAYDCSGTSRPVLRLYSGYSSHGKGHLRDDVKVLQRALNSEGGYSLRVDGYFGPNTDLKVRDWQLDNVLDVDGIVGVKTWTSLCDSPVQGGLMYPVAGYSSVPSFPNARGFGDQRNDGSRCHAGCDIQQGTVKAIDDGEVTNTYDFEADCSGGTVYAVLVYHPSLGVTVNYGEVNSNAVYVRMGQKVTKGQVLGKATRCGMVHFEVYKGRRFANQQWELHGGRYVGYGETCATKYPQTKPSALMNCENFLHNHF